MIISVRRWEGIPAVCAAPSAEPAALEFWQDSARKQRSRLDGAQILESWIFVLLYEGELLSFVKVLLRSSGTRRGIDLTRL